MIMGRRRKRGKRKKSDKEKEGGFCLLNAYHVQDLIILNDFIEQPKQVSCGSN